MDSIPASPYQLSTAVSHVGISVYDTKGCMVHTLVDEWQPRGMYSVTWDGRDNAGNPVSSGVYFYRMQAGTFVDSKKLVVLK